MKRFDLKDSQYEYELKRSIKKNRDITDWLSEKYGVFVNVTDKTLFHFTKKKNLSDIMKYGIIMGIFGSLLRILVFKNCFNKIFNFLRGFQYFK